MSCQSQQQQRLGAGSLPKEYVKYCIICKENGFPHEAIRILYNGRSMILVDYYTGHKHMHKFNFTKWSWDNYDYTI